MLSFWTWLARCSVFDNLQFIEGLFLGRAEKRALQAGSDEVMDTVRLSESEPVLLSHL